MGLDNLEQLSFLIQDKILSELIVCFQSEGLQGGLLFKGCNVGRVQVIERKDIKGSKPLWYFPSMQYFKFKHWKFLFFIIFFTSSNIDSCAKILIMFIIFSLVFIDFFHLILIFIAWQLPLFGLLSILSYGQITHSHFCFPHFWKFFFLNFFFFVLFLP